MVIRAGWGNIKSAALELADVGVDSDFKNSIRRAATSALDEGTEVEVRAIQGIKAGQNYLVDVELGAPEDWTIRKTDSVESAVRKSIGSKIRGVRRVRIRVVSKSNAAVDFADEFIGAEASPRINAEAEEHDHQHKK